MQQRGLPVYFGCTGELKITPHGGETQAQFMLGRSGRQGAFARDGSVGRRKAMMSLQ